MKTFILLGEKAITNFQEENWSDFQADVLMDYRGDIISWNKETDEVSELLEQLRGWNDFIELSQQDLKDIEANTKIEIE
mgnify:FL=1